MKHKINTGNYEYYVETKRVNSDNVCIQFYTRFDTAKDSEQLQMKFQMILSDKELQNLVAILQQEWPLTDR